MSKSRQKLINRRKLQKQISNQFPGDPTLPKKIKIKQKKNLSAVFKTLFFLLFVMRQAAYMRKHSRAIAQDSNVSVVHQ